VSREKGEFDAAEIVIVRRGGRGDEDGHHGGVWKIAYADFMTAMMAFFLVMWLVNAANEKTKQQVASYFNPIKLIDTRTNQKGLQSMDTGSSEAGKRGDPSGSRREPDSGEGTPPVAPASPGGGSPAGPATEQLQPVESVLKDILLIQGLTGQQGLDQREQLRTKASPVSDELAAQAPVQDEVADSMTGNNGLLANNAIGDLLAKADKVTGAASGDDVEPQPDKPSGDTTAQIEGRLSRVVSGPEAEIADQPSAAVPGDGVQQQQATEKRQELLESVKRLLEQSGYTPLVEGLSLNVEETREGVLISMAESSSTAMFDIATAEPSPALVELAGQLASALKFSEGRITIRGHTDGRSFFTTDQDNWRLSTDRAHTAYRLFLDAGLPPSRFERIEGYADTLLKVKTDPLAAANRRVEVLLRVEEPAQ
jgi:chemotaxis protein MotB